MTAAREQIAWLHRRVGFGLAPGELDVLEALGTDRVLDRLCDPDSAGVAPSPDPWEGIDLTPPDAPGQIDRAQVTATVGAWLRAMATTDRPLDEWMRWFWHGHFVSTLPVVKSPRLLVQQVRTLGALGLGDIGSLLRAITVDPAMLVYLDGRTNARGEVNENYGRELLELFSLGIGNYSEADVRAGSTALTGWVVERGASVATLVPRRHDPTPQTFLGHDDVHDVDGVIAAIVAHDACAPFLTGKLCRAILGPGCDPGLVDRLAADFRDHGLEVRPLLRAILEAGLDGAAGPIVRQPVVWFASAARALGLGETALADPAAGARAARTGFVRSGLANAGQVPFNAPNVAGWPGGAGWLTASADVGRWNLAFGLARLGVPADDNNPARVAAAGGDLGALADALGRPGGFSAATASALSGIASRPTAPGTDRLALALISPDLVVDDEVPA